MRSFSEHGLSNVRVIRGDAFVLLDRHLAPECLNEVCIFFPDPWPKEADEDRRIVRGEVIQRVGDCINPHYLFRHIS